MATRNRKLLRANGLAPWELRIDRWRVYYEVREGERGPFVLVKAVGRRERSKVVIAGEEIDL